MTVASIAQLSVRPVEAAELDTLLDAVVAADGGSGGDWTAPTDGTGEVWWLLAEQSDGYTVARHDGGRWRTARSVTDRVTPFAPSRLAELRVFRSGAELLVHPVGDEGLRGVWRVRTDDVVDAPLRVRDDRAVQFSRGRTRADQRDGFTTLRRPDGSVTVVPFGHDRPALRVREHFAADDGTGAVRVAVTCLDHYTPSAFEEDSGA